MRFLQGTAMTTLLLIAGLTSAAERPAHYPPSFPVAGIATEVDTLRGRLIVNDLLLYIDSHTEVYSPRGRTSLVDLKEGNTLGIRYATDGDGKLRAEEIWILPSIRSALPPPP